ncbi:MAG: arsenosugar biosynthesis-associated peroxidase-like protein, partial [Myxococcota bacterium]
MSTSESYYHRRHLPAFSSIGQGNADLARRFFDYYGAAFADGAMSVRLKDLTALAVAHIVQCPYCIDAYTKGSLEAGSDLDQMTEAVHVAAATRAGSTVGYGMQMRTQAGELQMGADAPKPVDGYFERRQVDALNSMSDGAPDLFSRLQDYQSSVFDDGALERREKALIALACAHALQCPYSIDRAVRMLEAEDVGLDEMTEAIHVATAIRGGASLVHGIQMLEQVAERRVRLDHGAAEALEV